MGGEIDKERDARAAGRKETGRNPGAINLFYIAKTWPIGKQKPPGGRTARRRRRGVGYGKG